MKFAGNETITALIGKVKEALGVKMDKSVYDPDGDGKVASAVSADSAASAKTAASAQSAATAEDATKLGGKAAGEYLLSADMTELSAEDVDGLWNG